MATAGQVLLTYLGLCAVWVCLRFPGRFHPAECVFPFCAVKGIYRVNGAKSRVEKLCQAFENGKHLVELSELYPHDISNVLKLYLRQVGPPA